MSPFLPPWHLSTHQPTPPPEEEWKIPAGLAHPKSSVADDRCLIEACEGRGGERNWGAAEASGQGERRGLEEEPCAVVIWPGRFFSPIFFATCCRKKEKKKDFQSPPPHASNAFLVPPLRPLGDRRLLRIHLIPSNQAGSQGIAAAPPPPPTHVFRRQSVSLINPALQTNPPPPCMSEAAGKTTNDLDWRFAKRGNGARTTSEGRGRGGCTRRGGRSLLRSQDDG